MTVKALLKTSYKSTDDTCQIVIRVIDGKANRFIPVGYKVKKTQWKNNEVVKHDNAAFINATISNILNDAKIYIAECKMNGRKPDINMIGHKPSLKSFNAYLNTRARQYEAKEMNSAAGRVRNLITDLESCFKKVLYFGDIKSEDCNAYDAYLIKQGNSANYRHKKFATLRQIYNNGSEGGQNPFASYKIKETPVKKEKLNAAEIEMIERLELSGDIDHARNMFLFSYYTKGLRFANCLTLRHSDIYNGRIEVTTVKGGTIVSVLIHAKLQKILDKYKSGPFVFPFIKQEPKRKTEYQSLISTYNTIVNRYLKIIIASAGIHKKISFHNARHSFAYNLKKVTLNVNIIQQALGHASQKTTIAYLKDLDDEIIDIEMAKLYGD